MGGRAGRWAGAPPFAARPIARAPAREAIIPAPRPRTARDAPFDRRERTERLAARRRQILSGERRGSLRLRKLPSQHIINSTIVEMMMRPSTPLPEAEVVPPPCASHLHGAPRFVRVVDDRAFERAAALFRAAGDPARLRLLHQLEGGEQCVTALAEATDTKLSTLSQQLRVLHAERMVKRRRSGKHILYSLADDHVSELVRAALDHASEARVSSTATPGDSP